MIILIQSQHLITCNNVYHLFFLGGEGASFVVLFVSCFIFTFFFFLQTPLVSAIFHKSTLVAHRPQMSKNSCRTITKRDKTWQKIASFYFSYNNWYGLVVKFIDFLTGFSLNLFILEWISIIGIVFCSCYKWTRVSFVYFWLVYIDKTFFYIYKLMSMSYLTIFITCT